MRNGLRLAFGLLLSLLLCLPTGVAAQDEGGGSFEGWETDSGEGKEKAKDEKKETPAPPVTETPAPTPEPAPKPEIGPGAQAPGSHEGFVPTVSVRYGSVTMLGVFQGLMDTGFIVNDNGADDDAWSRLQFRLQRARIMLKGHLISEDFTYFFQGDAANTFSFALDMYLGYQFKFSGQSLTVQAGRFVPEFSYMMPRNTADLAAINYPVYLTGAGAFATWRQIGIQVTYKPIEAFTLILGGFNGLQTDPFTAAPGASYMQMVDISVGGVTVSNVGDNNKAKDFLLRGAYKMGDLSLDMNLWFGMPVNANNGENDFFVMGGPGAEYNNGKMHIVGEFMFRQYMYDDATDDVTSLGMWAHFGYRVTDLFEPMFRVDWYEPNLDNDADMLMRITAGTHFWLEEKHFRILINMFFDIPLEDTDPAGRDAAMGLQIQAAALW